MKKKRYTLTAALPYANGPIHIGHMAGVYIPADIYARYLRLNNHDTLLVCGSDEHGVPVTIRAKQENSTVQEVVDKYHHLIKDSFEKFGISFDIYARTSSPVHHEMASGFFKKLYDEGKLEEKITEQFYDPEAQQFLADRYIQGTCPKCQFEEAYGDQCENCGSTLSPTDLIHPVSKLSGAKPIKKSTKHWYLPLQKYENWLKKWILEEHQDWKTNVYGQCKSWLDQGLQARAVTRDLDWGVKVPLEDATGKVLYVWFDAPIGYISATKEFGIQQHNQPDFWKKYWQDEDAELIHFIGKDNIVFHCIIFPTMLHAHEDYIVPENVPANEFLNLEGKKISTSRNWAVWLHEYLEDFEDKQDVLRYVLCANAPETKDNDFTWADFQAKNNNELVANLGNFINRVIVLTHKYFEGRVPEKGVLGPVEEELTAQLKQLPQNIGNAIEKYRFREALGLLMDLSRSGNKYLAETEPWKLIKEDEGRVKTILNLSLQIAANFAIMAQPFLPSTAEKLIKALGLTNTEWKNAGKTDLLSDHQPVEKIPLLFEKIDDEIIEAQIQKLKKPNQMNHKEAINPFKEEIQFDDFLRQDIRVASILTAEKVEKSNKLLKITLDTGIDKRTILSGIAQHFSPEEIIGRQVCVLVNLAPRTMMGVQSQGMILMAEDHEGKLTFIEPSTKINNGATIS